MKNALLVVDVQQFYVSDLPDDLPHKIAKRYESINYDHIVFGVFRNKEDSNFVRSLKWTKCFQAADARLPAVLQTFAHEDNVFERAAYSVFKTTGLDAYLRRNDVERLVICGVDTDACVLATAFEAFDLGYHVKIDFGLTYSTGNLETETKPIAYRSLFSRD